MRVLLDVCLPHRLRHELAPHDVQTAKFAGLDGLLDGALLDAMVGSFDILVTVDASLPRQQNISRRSVAVVLLRARGNRLPDLLPLVPNLLRTLDEVQPGEVRDVSGGP